jgi:putative sugar O-methyltransferase
MSRWENLTARTLDEVERCDPAYRPTTFWGPGVRTILDDLEHRGLSTFKSWPSASIWFYPTYGSRLTPQAMDASFESARRLNADIERRWFRSALGGDHQARRDFDVARLAWDQARWPFDLDGLGESEVGVPPQTFRLRPEGAAIWTRPYLNYLLCLAGLSRHVDSSPRRFLELGGGFGVLGEIVLSRAADAVYVNLDLPPLLTVASSYLDTLFGDRVATYESFAAEGALEVSGSACLPNWRIRDLRAPFDVFLNSFSFQEMEPDVVERYADDVAALEVSWVVSLNSRAGKPVQGEDRPIGVTTPVTSRAIIELFEARGYRCVATYADPLLQHQAELAILRRDGRAAGSAPEPAAEVPSPSIDLRRASAGATPSREERKAARQAKKDRRRARAALAGRLLDGLRAVRRRLRRR